MSLVEWRPEFSVGNPGVDHEHQELINLINSLHAQLLEDPSRDGTLDFLGEILAKISSHFAHEEKVMRDNTYDEFEQHKADHEELLDEIHDIMDQVERYGIFDREELSRRMGDWFGEHFRPRDARLHRRPG